MSTLRLPSDLQTSKYQINDYLINGEVTIEVPDEYLRFTQAGPELSEVICIQRLIALGNAATIVRVRWGSEMAKQVLRSPSIFPLLAVLLCLDDAEHILYSGVTLNVTAARKDIYTYSLRADFFSDVQVVLCADKRGHGRPPALYTSEAGELISREDFESLIDGLLSTHTGYDVTNTRAVFFIKSIATIVAELFENTEIHGRLGIDDKPIAKNGLRGILFKRMKVTHDGEWIKIDAGSNFIASGNSRKDVISTEALEISIFDAGVGFYSSYTRRDLDSTVPLIREWEVVHKCLERHYDDDEPSYRPAHRAMGLYEVLRALKMVNGLLEVRSGRIFGYRTFIPGELKFQLESEKSTKRPNMPKPVLLDRDRKYVRFPTEHEHLSGSSIRVVIPLL